MSEWISVKDKLPPEYQRVLIYCRGEMHVGKIEYYEPVGSRRKGGEWWWGNDNCSSFVEKGVVSHWTELPIDPPN